MTCHRFPEAKLAEPCPFSKMGRTFASMKVARPLKSGSASFAIHDHSQTFDPIGVSIIPDPAGHLGDYPFPDDAGGGTHSLCRRIARGCVGQIG